MVVVVGFVVGMGMHPLQGGVLNHRRMVLQLQVQVLR
jgi:hypothetical protein